MGYNHFVEIGLPVGCAAERALQQSSSAIKSNETIPWKKLQHTPLLITQLGGGANGQQCSLLGREYREYSASSSFEAEFRNV